MHLIKNSGKVRKKDVRDDKGRVVGALIEHKDGRVDAVARPAPIRGRTAAGNDR